MRKGQVRSSVAVRQSELYVTQSTGGWDTSSLLALSVVMLIEGLGKLPSSMA